MAYDLQTLLGSELTVGLNNRRMQRQYLGFAGAHGLATIALGTRGFELPISGVIRATGTTYKQARNNAVMIAQNLEALQAAEPADYFYKGTTYLNCIFENFRLVPSANGRIFVPVPGGCLARYEITLRGLV
ncbi:MAG TPA: hypothetical protein PKY88_13165 [Anaerohalosphaeraceae bacterium]|nr:hypothetical protein [Anaerohalosphaeraceae bacterium]